MSFEKEIEKLNAKLLVAHDKGDVSELIKLYRAAGELREGEGDINAACFYYTHAYVFALEHGDLAASALKQKLADYGREKPD